MMKNSKYALLMILLSTNAFALTAKEAHKRTNAHHHRYDMERWEQCRKQTYNEIYHAIDDYGNFNVSFTLPNDCWGNDIDRIQNVLKKDGYKVQCTEVGKEGVHYNNYCVVEW